MNAEPHSAYQDEQGPAASGRARARVYPEHVAIALLITAAACFGGRAYVQLASGVERPATTKQEWPEHHDCIFTSAK